MEGDGDEMTDHAQQSTPLSAETEQAIRERRAKITQGKWRLSEIFPNYSLDSTWERPDVLTMTHIADITWQTNADFIANAPADIDALLATTDALHVQLAAAEARAEVERETRIEWGRERQTALDQLRWSEARATRYKAERDAALKIAQGMDQTLDMEGISGDDHNQLYFLLSELDLPEAARDADDRLAVENEREEAGNEQ